MSIDDIIQSGADVTLVVKSGELKEFADHLVERTIDGMKKSFIKPDEGYLTIKEASQMLHADKSTLWRWNRIGYLCNVEVGGKRLYKKSDIDAILQKN